ncbi:MAG: hypothetical protein AB7S48_03220 [Bacteroidales bacterium]
MKLKQIDFSKISILLIAILVIFINLNSKPWKKGRVIHDDIISYYCYLPAAIIHHDLTFEFTKANHDFYADKYWPLQTPEGKDVVKMTMGLSFLYLPFFLIGHLTALISGTATDGYSLPYLILLQISAIVYLLLGLMILRNILIRWFKPRIVGIVLIATFIGTNMLHYSTLEATMSHIYNFFLFSLFFLLTAKFWELPKFKYWIFLGLLTGLITLVRPTNGIIALFFVFWGVNSTQTLKNRFDFIFKNWQFVILASALAFVIWIPQLLYWKSATGHWLYYSYNNEGFFFLKPHILDGIFSYRKGWLIYSPIMVLPLIGLILLAIKKRFEWFWPLTIFASINIYIIFSWWSWWYGGGLGARPLIESYALLTLPFAYLLNWLDEKLWRKIVGYSILTLFTLFGLMVNFQYRYMAIHWDSMSKAAYWDSFLRLKPSGRLNYLLQTPDYESAIDGKKESITKQKYQPISQNIIYTCNCDSVDNACTKIFHSMEKSIVVNKSSQYGMSADITLQPNKKYIAQVWRYGNPNAKLVVHNSNINFYLNTKTTVDIDSTKWELLTIEFTTPNSYSPIPFKIYVWNPNCSNAYFDDLTIGEVN